MNVIKILFVSLIIGMLSAPVSQAVEPGDNPAYRPVNRTTGVPIMPIPLEGYVGNKNIGWRAFKKLPTAKCIRKRESRNQHRVVSSNGQWHGLYQFATPTWLNMGGGKYAPVASQATRKQQHKIAYKTWKKVGWSPWYHATKPCY